MMPSFHPDAHESDHATACGLIPSPQAAKILAELESNHRIASNGLAHLSKRERQLASLKPPAKQGKPSIAVVGLQEAIREIETETGNIVELALESFSRCVQKLRLANFSWAQHKAPEQMGPAVDALVESLRETTAQALPEELRTSWMASTERLILEKALGAKGPAKPASKSRL